MMPAHLDSRLRELFGERVQRDAPLAALTTFKVGGNADWLLTLQTPAELQQAVLLARDAAVPITIIGGGSNVLISDAGVRGLVVKLRRGNVVRLPTGHVRADAAVTINGLVRWTINRGLAGVEAWAGTPGTVGGAIYGNAHFQGRNIGELIDQVQLVDENANVIDVSASDMEFGYDFSRLHRTREFVVSADFHAADGDPDALRTIARQSLAFRKSTQPLESASAGCIFQNPDRSRDKVPAGIPASAGALVDRAGLKGSAEGKARVSARHANFIVNEGGSTAAEIRTLIDRCKREVRDRFGVELREEIVYVGFE